MKRKIILYLVLIYASMVKNVSPSDELSYQKLENHRSLGLNSSYERNETNRFSLKKRSQKCIGPNRDSLPYICKCRRHDFYVDFKDLGWERMTISPKVFNIYKCMGDCSLSSGSIFNQKLNKYMTPHAWFMAALNFRNPELYGQQQMPNCVPIQLKPLVVMFYYHGKRMNQVFNDTIVEKCGCR